MKSGTAFLGAAVGAALMYLFDPDRGNYRRSVAREQAVSRFRHWNQGLEVAVRDLRNRTTGIFAELAAWARGGPIPDRVLAERVRTLMGRIVSHPRAVDVSVNRGAVRLSGPVLSDEYRELCLSVRSMRGVERVEDRLSVHEPSEQLPALQGGRPRHRRPDILQDHWSPATRLILGAAGTSLAVNALRSRGPLNAALGLAGSALVLQAFTDRPRRQPHRLAADTGTLVVHKTIGLDVPVAEAYGFWERFENFPEFLSHLREVRLNEDGSARWIAAGPEGTSLEWETVTTRREPERELAWRTKPGSAVEHSGTIHFEPMPDGGTRAHITFAFGQGDHGAGEAVSRLLGPDPESSLQSDFLRMKSLVESQPRQAAPEERPAAIH
jgi:uncharacterized membrane protein